MEQCVNDHEVQSKRTSKQIIFGQEYKAIDSLVFCGMVIVIMGIVLTIMGGILLSEDDAVSFVLFTLFNEYQSFFHQDTDFNFDSYHCMILIIGPSMVISGVMLCIGRVLYGKFYRNVLVVKK